MLDVRPTIDGGEQEKFPCAPETLLKFNFSSGCDLIVGDRLWPESKGRLSVPLSLSTLGRMLPRSHLSPSPLLWLWLPPDVTRLPVAAQPPEPVGWLYFSQLFSSAVSSEEFHTCLNCCGYFKSNSIKCKAACGEKWRQMWGSCVYPGATATLCLVTIQPLRPLKTVESSVGMGLVWNGALERSSVHLVQLSSM